MLTEPITLPHLRELDGDNNSSDTSNANQMHGILTDLVQVSARLTRLANRVVKDPESLATWRTLSVLQGSGPMRVGELAALSQVAQPTMTKIVAGLVERDWIKRIADSDDARAWQLAISSKGVRALTEWRGKLASGLLPLFADLTDGDAQAIRRTIELLRPRVAQVPVLAPASAE